jgi:hypothetical protein
MVPGWFWASAQPGACFAWWWRHKGLGLHSQQELVYAVTGRLLWMLLQRSIVDGGVVRPVAPRADTCGMCLVSPGRWWLGGSACRCPDPQPVAVRVAKLDLTPIWRFTSGSAELSHNGVDVTDYQVDQSVWPGVTSVLGEEQPRAARDRHERGHAGLEAVLPIPR